MYRQLGGLETRRMLILLAKAAIAGLALAGVCAASLHWLLADWSVQPFVRKTAGLFVTIVAGGLVFTACGAALKIEELHEVMTAVRRRLGRRA